MLIEKSRFCLRENDEEKVMERLANNSTTRTKNSSLPHLSNSGSVAASVGASLQLKVETRVYPPGHGMQ